MLFPLCPHLSSLASISYTYDSTNPLALVGLCRTAADVVEPEIAESDVTIGQRS